MLEVLADTNLDFFLYDRVSFIGDDTEIEKGTLGVIEDMDNNSFYIHWYPDNKDDFVKAVNKYGYKEENGKEIRYDNLLLERGGRTTDILRYGGYRATVKFHSLDTDPCSLYGIVRNIKDHPKTYIFDIPDPKKANETFKEYVESLIADGLLPKD